jgi:hypothetical protein
MDGEVPFSDTGNPALTPSSRLPMEPEPELDQQPEPEPELELEPEPELDQQPEPELPRNNRDETAESKSPLDLDGPEPADLPPSWDVTHLAHDLSVLSAPPVRSPNTLTLQPLDPEPLDPESGPAAAERAAPFRWGHCLADACDCKPCDERAAPLQKPKGCHRLPGWACVSSCHRLLSAACVPARRCEPCRTRNSADSPAPSQQPPRRAAAVARSPSNRRVLCAV